MGLKMGKTIVNKEKLAAKSGSKTQKKKEIVLWKFPFDRMNFIWLAAGIGVILVGYAFMATGLTSEPAHTVGTWNNPLAIFYSPLLLVIGYCILIPLGIMKIFKKKEEDKEQ